MPVEIAAYQHGIYPRSEDLVAATRNLARGRTSADAVEARRDRDRTAFVELQQEAGLDYFSTGLLDWQDLFRPLVDSCPGLTAGPLTRWFDNNTFFRAPVPDGPARLDAGGFARIASVDRVPEPRAGVLPGPYTFARAVAAGGGRENLMTPLARDVLRPAAEVLVAHGCRLLHLQEPWLAYRGVGGDIDWTALERALAAVRDGIGVPVVLHTYFGDAGPMVAQLRALPLDAVGVDLVETDVDALAGPWDVGILAGCVDGRSSVVEPAHATLAAARRVLEVAQPPLLLLSSSCDLELLPRAVADRKVRLLGQVSRQLRTEVGC